MTVKRFDLKDVLPNPWQVRITEDPEHIQQLALSIARDGLLQIPVGRRHNGKVQLAFGMSRLAAFRKLKEDRMPVDVKKLSDERMFELAIIENESRQDLSPIEQAKAMRRAMDEFGMSRTKVANLFGIQPGSVSNKVNLLELPDDVQQLVQDGLMPERTARGFLNLARLKPEIASRVAGDVVSKGEADEDYIAQQVTEGMRAAAKEIGGPWDRGKVEGKWWKFETRHKGPLAVPPVQARNAIQDLANEGGHIVYTVTEDNAQVLVERKPAQVAKQVLALFSDGQDPDTLVQLFGYPQAVIDRIEHLRNPPACTACPFHSLMRERHFCAMKPCLITRKQHMKAKGFESATRKKAVRGISEYAKKDDGDWTAYPGGSTSYGYTGPRRDAAVVAFDRALAGKRDRKHLRLIRRSPGMYHSQYPITESPFAELVAVGPLLEKLSKAMDTAAEAPAGPDSWEAQRAERERNAWLNGRLIEAAAPLLAPAFKDLRGRTAELLVWMTEQNVDLGDFGKVPLWDDWPEWSVRRRNAECQRYFGWRLAREAGAVGYGADPQEVVKEIEALAGKLDLALPTDWTDEPLTAPAEDEEADDDDS